MKKIISLVIIALFVFAPFSLAFTCQRSNVAGQGEQCWNLVEIASDETTLVSKGTVLVYDVSNNISSTEGSWRVDVANASADGAFVAGVAQTSIATGDQAMVLVRGKGRVFVKANETTEVAAMASGDALWVSTSGDVSEVSSTTIGDIGFALEQGASGDSYLDAYITIV